jgi:hypothetical protein
MLKALSVFLQFVLYLITYAAGSFFLHPFHVQTVLADNGTGTRIMIWDGLLLMLVLFGLVLLIEALMRQFRRLAVWSTVAVVLAGVCGLAMKFGILNTSGR